MSIASRYGKLAAAVSRSYAEAGSSNFGLAGLIGESCGWKWILRLFRVMTHSSKAVTTLLSQAIDYAGLFPPAALGMAAAVREYQEAGESQDRWALGRFVVPAARLTEWLGAFTAARAETPDSGGSLNLAVLAAADLKAGLNDIDKIRTALDQVGVVIAAIEGRATNPQEAYEVASRLPPRVDKWVEIPWSGPVGEFIDAVQAGGAAALPRNLELHHVPRRKRSADVVGIERGRRRARQGERQRHRRGEPRHWEPPGSPGAQSPRARPA